MNGFYYKSRITEESFYKLIRTKYKDSGCTMLQLSDKILYDYFCAKACFKQQPYNDMGTDIKVDVGEYVISREDLFKAMQPLGVFDSEGALRRSIERLEKFGLIKTDTNGHPTRRFKVLHYNSHYDCEPHIERYKCKVRTKGLSKPKALNINEKDDALSQTSRQIKEECNIKEVCNTSNYIDTNNNIPNNIEPKSCGSDVVIQAIAEDNKGPAGPYQCEGNSSVSECDNGYFDDDENYKPIDIVELVKKHIIEMENLYRANSKLTHSISGDDSDPDDDEEEDEEWDDLDNNIDDESLSSPEDNLRSKSYNEQDLHSYAIQLAKYRIAKHFGCGYHELPAIETSRAEEYAKIKSYYINFMGRNYSALMFAEEIKTFIAEWKIGCIQETIGEDTCHNGLPAIIPDEVVETIREKQLDNPDIDFIEKTQKYIVTKMINPYKLDIAYLFQSEILDGILEVNPAAPNIDKYWNVEWKPI